MTDRRIWLTLALGGTFICTETVAAQVGPLPPRPSGPTVTAPSIAPLQIVEAPSGEVLGSYIFGVTADRSDKLMVRTAGGQGRVTITVTIEGRTGGTALVDPPAATLPGGLALANNRLPPTTSGTAVLQASPVSKIIVIQGYGDINRSAPPRQKVIVVARDSGGAEVRREFHVRFTRAMGLPNTPEASASRTPATTTAPYHGTAAQAQTLYDPEVRLTPYQTVELTSRGYSLNFARLDPGSEVICVYGTFRYACDFVVTREAAREELAQTMEVKVPDLGRGKQVGIILKNAYGETPKVMVDINTQTRVQLRRSRRFAGPVAGAQPGVVAPFYNGSPIGDNGASRTCDRPYLVWVDATTDGKMFADTKGSPVSLKLMGDASVRVKRVPRGQIITNNIATSWADLEFNVPAGVLQDYLFTTEMTYDTRIGECPARRR